MDEFKYNFENDNSNNTPAPKKNDTTGVKFIIVEGSQSGHCCFDYSIVDTGEDGGTVCECFSKYAAEMIADALNKTITNG